MNVNILGELKIDRIKRHNEIFIVIDLLKGIDNTRLTSNTPDKFLMRKGIVQTHALLVDQGELIFVYGRQIVSVKSQLTTIFSQFSAIKKVFR
jgi:glycerol-3-phosphate responsive antiterminator